MIKTIYRFFDDRVKKLSIIDVKLAQGAAMCIMIILAKIFPVIMEISIPLWIIFAIILGVRPMYAFFLKT
jgi:hypothetical protein